MLSPLLLLVDIASSTLSPPLVDLLGEVDGLLSSGESSTAMAIEVPHIRGLLALLELIFSEVGTKEGGGALCNKGAVPTHWYGCGPPQWASSWRVSSTSTTTY